MGKNYIIEFTNEAVIGADMVSAMLCSALEGGSNYWYNIASVENRECAKYIGDVPISGGAIIIEDMENNNKQYRLDEAAIEKGLKTFLGLKYYKGSMHRHVLYLLNRSSNMDATTGDIFLQCCLFGRIGTVVEFRRESCPTTVTLQC